MPENKPALTTDDAMHDLIQRLRATRITANPWADDPSKGLPAAELTSLLDRWGNGFDWRAHEARIQALPWTVTADGSLRVIHQRSANASAPALVLLHGWPDSVLRFERILPLLTDFHLVVPALPGFPFSMPLSAPVSSRQIAEIVADAMRELGYDHYIVSGADIGSTIGEIMAAEHPDRIGALHLANVAAAHVASADPHTLPADAVAYLDYVGQWRRTEAGFIAEQSTRPSTLIAGLGDSPAGLLAWIAEKLYSWSDGPAFTPDEILTWVSAYWFTGTIGTSFSTYVAPSRLPDYVASPVVLSTFAHDIIPAPRSYAEHFVDVREFPEHASGGHFAAWEQPELYAADIRAAAALSTRTSSLTHP